MQENPVFCVSKKRKSTMTITKFQPKPQKPLSVLHALRASVPRHRSKFCSNKLDSPLAQYPRTAFGLAAQPKKTKSKPLTLNR